MLDRFHTFAFHLAAKQQEASPKPKSFHSKAEAQAKGPARISHTQQAHLAREREPLIPAKKQPRRDPDPRS